MGETWLRNYPLAVLGDRLIKGRRRGEGKKGRKGRELRYLTHYARLG